MRYEETKRPKIWPKAQGNKQFIITNHHHHHDQDDYPPPPPQQSLCLASASSQSSPLAQCSKDHEMRRSKEHCHVFVVIPCYCTTHCCASHIHFEFTIISAQLDPTLQLNHMGVPWSMVTIPDSNHNRCSCFLRTKSIMLFCSYPCLRLEHH